MAWGTFTSYKQGCLNLSLDFDRPVTRALGSDRRRRCWCYVKTLNLKGHATVFFSKHHPQWKAGNLSCVVLHCQREKKQQKNQNPFLVLPPHRRPRRNPLPLRHGSDGETWKPVPAWSPSLGPCWPLVWLPAWPRTPPAEGTYVAVEVAIGKAATSSLFFHTTHDAGQLTKHDKKKEKVTGALHKKI